PELNDETSQMSRHCLQPLPFRRLVRLSTRTFLSRILRSIPLSLANGQCRQTVTKKEKHVSQQNQPFANDSNFLSRRRFITSAGILTAAAWFSPRHLFAEGENIVLAARKRAETANITVHTLRGNVNALIVSGGNIAVVSGTDGNLVIDSGCATC